MSLNAHRPEPVALLAPEPNYGSRLGLCGRRGSLFWLWQAKPRAWSPLLRLLRLCYGSFLLSAVGDFEAERDLRLRVGVGSATASLARSADFDAARDRLRAGFASEPKSTSTGVSAAGDDISGVACAFGLRPNPRVFANVERRSE
jgi:hypothetical protein